MATYLNSFLISLPAAWWGKALRQPMRRIYIYIYMLFPQGSAPALCASKCMHLRCGFCTVSRRQRKTKQNQGKPRKSKGKLRKPQFSLSFLRFPQKNKEKHLENKEKQQ